jgi:hypothetical protein
VKKETGAYSLRSRARLTCRNRTSSPAARPNASDASFSYVDALFVAARSTRMREENQAQKVQRERQRKATGGLRSAHTKGRAAAAGDRMQHR